MTIGIKLPRPGDGFTVEAVEDVIKQHIAERRTTLRKEMENPATEHRRRDVIAGALDELARLESPPTEHRPASPTTQPLYG